MKSLESRPDLTTPHERLSAPLAASARWRDRQLTLRPLVVDVRAPAERAQKRIKGSIGIPLNHLAERLPELPGDRPLVVHCAGGYRSSIAASLLQHHGFSDVSEIAGGLAAWEAASLPVESNP